MLWLLWLIETSYIFFLIIESVDNPELFYIQEYFDVIVVPASIGKYRIRNLGNQPVCIHKTMLKDGFENDGK